MIPLVKTMMRRVPQPIAIVTASADTGPKQGTDPTTLEAWASFAIPSGWEEMEDPWDPEHDFGNLKNTLRPLSPNTRIARKNGAKALLNPDYRRNYMSRYRGLTVSSFNTVTLFPRPTFSFNIKSPSSTLDAIFQSGLLRIHILSQVDVSKDIATIFARDDPQEKKWESIYNLSNYVTGRMLRVRHMLLPEQAPMLSGRSILAHVPCRVIRKKCVEVGDHMIVVAEPYDEPQMPALSETESDIEVESPVNSGMLYLNGQFRKHLESDRFGLEADKITDPEIKRLIMAAARKASAEYGVNSSRLELQLARALWPRAAQSGFLRASNQVGHGRLVRAVRGRFKIRRFELFPSSSVRRVKTEAPHDKDITALFQGKGG